MSDTIMWFLDVAWKILGLVFGWMLLKFVLKNGRETIRDLMETTHLGLQALGIKARLLLRQYLSKEKTEKKKESEDETQEDKDKPIEMTFDEWRDFNKFMEAMKNGRPFSLK